MVSVERDRVLLDFADGVKPGIVVAELVVKFARIFGNGKLGIFGIADEFKLHAKPEISDVPEFFLGNLDDPVFAVGTVALVGGNVRNDMVSDVMAFQSFFESDDHAVAAVHIDERIVFGNFFDDHAVFIFQRIAYANFLVFLDLFHRPKYRNTILDSMLYGIFSDIHANLPALEAVLESMKSHGVERRVCLGDIVGYGANPNECVALTRENVDVCILGNHDSVAIKWDSTAGFNPYARKAIEWTQDALTEDSKSYLKTLPYLFEENDICFAHASPMSPAEWIYITDLEDALDAFDHFGERHCFVGHTHSPVIVAMRDGEIPKVIETGAYVLEEGERLLMNVGSVGQPRDRDPRACYCLYDSEREAVNLVRVEYDIARTQDAMRVAGMPGFLVERLELGR